MSARTDQLRREAESARKDLVGTIGQLGDAVNEARHEAVEQVKRFAPAAGGAAGGLILLKLLAGRRRRRKRRDDD
jgi:hypothetical protein